MCSKEFESTVTSHLHVRTDSLNQCHQGGGVPEKLKTLQKDVLNEKSENMIGYHRSQRKQNHEGVQHNNDDRNEFLDIIDFYSPLNKEAEKGSQSR